MSENNLIRQELRALAAKLKCELAIKCPRVDVIKIIFDEVLDLIERHNPKCVDMHCSDLMPQIVYTAMA